MACHTNWVKSKVSLICPFQSLGGPECNISNVDGVTWYSKGLVPETVFNQSMIQYLRIPHSKCLYILLSGVLNFSSDVQNTRKTTRSLFNVIVHFMWWPDVIDYINSSTWIICIDKLSQTGSGSTCGGWEYPLSHRDDAITPQRRFINSPPLVVHTERSTAGIKTNRHVIHTESCAAAPKETWRYTSWWWRRGVSQVSPLSI